MNFVLNEKVDEYLGILRVILCIFCFFEGYFLVLLLRLIYFEGRVVKLFDIKDGRFFYGFI